MNQAARSVAFVTALLALSAVIMAAMGSHMIEMSGLESLWQTASIMHLFSAASLLGLAALLARLQSSLLAWGTWLIVFGTIIFCGSIYLHVITAYVLPKVAPAGGMLMMAGWLLVALSFLRKS